MTVARPTRHQDGVTLIETLVAITLVGTFFAAIFEINAVCLRYIDASKEAVAAVQGVQDRIEGLRNLAFNDLTSPAYMMSAQATPAPSGPRPVSLVYPSNSSDLASEVTEEVTVSAYPSGSPSITYTRTPGAAVYPSASPNTTGDFSTTTLVRVTVKYTWNATFSQRQQSEEAETLISAGTKK
jgi:prepilin-type N-terminal cleavage/methylation domain-containing protein